MKMKKIAIISILAAALLSSCMVEEGDNVRRVTEKGLLIYGLTTDEVISQYVFGLDAVLKMDEIINSPLEKRDSLEDLYFYQCIIRNVGDTCRIRGYADIVPDGNSITGTGAHWQYISGGMKLDIYNTAENEYKLVADNTTQPNYPITSSAELYATVMPITGTGRKYNSINEYSVTGTGKYIETIDNYYYLYDWGGSQRIDGQTHTVTYTITNPLGLCQYAANEIYIGTLKAGYFYYYEGGLKMTVNGDGTGNKDEEIISSSGYDYSLEEPVVNITYNGVTEVW